MSFSDEIGRNSGALEHGEMSLGTTNAVWSVLLRSFFANDEIVRLRRSGGVLSAHTSRVLFERINGPFWRIVEDLWHEDLERASDELSSSYEGSLEQVRAGFFESPWYRRYDVVERVVSGLHSEGMARAANDLCAALNAVLESRRVGYRIVGKNVVPLTDPMEIETINVSLASEEPLAGARLHLGRALEQLSDRRVPSYENAVKEAISAVESAARGATGKSSLRGGLQVLVNRGELPEDFAEVFRRLWTYSNKEGGVRHAIIGAPAVVRPAEARFFLAISAAFVNLLADGQTRRRSLTTEDK